MQYRENHVISRKSRHIEKIASYHADHVISRISRFPAGLICFNIVPGPARAGDRRFVGGTAAINLKEQRGRLETEFPGGLFFIEKV